jgi:hypothetical protein
MENSCLRKNAILPALLVVFILGFVFNANACFRLPRCDTPVAAFVIDTHGHARPVRPVKVDDTTGLARSRFGAPNRAMSAALLTASLVSAGCFIAALATASWLLLIPWLVLAVLAMLRVGGFYTSKVMHRAACWSFYISCGMTYGLILAAAFLAIGAVAAILWPFNAVANLFKKKANRRNLWGMPVHPKRK